MTPCALSLDHPTPTEYLLILLGIQSAELRRRGATLSIANRGCLHPDHILHGQFHRSQNVSKKGPKSRPPFVLAARKLLDSLSKIGICATQWTNTKWNMEYQHSKLS